MQAEQKLTIAAFSFPDELRLQGIRLWSDTIEQIEMLHPELEHLEVVYPKMRENFLDAKESDHPDPKRIISLWAIKKAWAEVLHHRREGDAARLDVRGFLSQLESLILDVTTHNPLLTFSDEA